MKIGKFEGEKIMKLKKINSTSKANKKHEIRQQKIDNTIKKMKINRTLDKMQQLNQKEQYKKIINLGEKINKRNKKNNRTHKAIRMKRFKITTRIRNTKTLSIMIIAILLLILILVTKLIPMIVMATEGEETTQIAKGLTKLREDDKAVYYQTTEKDGTHKEVPVPKGFSPSYVDGEMTVDGGFVIYDVNGDSLSEDGYTIVYDENAMFTKVDENGNKYIDWNQILTDKNNEVVIQKETEEKSYNQVQNKAKVESEKSENNIANNKVTINTTNTANAIENKNSTNTTNTTNTNVNNTDNETTITTKVINGVNIPKSNTPEIINTNVSNSITTNITNNINSSNLTNTNIQNQQQIITQNNIVENEIQSIKENEPTQSKETEIPIIENNNKIEETTSEVQELAEGEKEITQQDINIFNLQKTHNQFVWVPVEDMSRVFGIDSNGKIWGKLYNASGSLLNWDSINNKPNSATGYREPDVIKTNGESMLNEYLSGQTKYELLSKEMEESFNKTIKSIQKYKGFYIGRYETGRIDKAITAKAVVRKMNENIGAISWYNSYKSAKELSNNNNVETNLIWGSLWDETFQWLVEKEVRGTDGEKISMVDSASWGNYANSKSNFKYISKTATKPEETEQLSSNSKIPSGSTDYTKTNNIYDLAGNVCEWTLESYETVYMINRGGNYDINSSNSSVGNRGGYYHGYYYPRFGDNTKRNTSTTLYKVV